MTIVNLLTGLGIFLFGMMQLEKSLETLGTNWIKNFLSRSTERPMTSVISGTFITAILQSSSLVGLLVLAFASAGMIPLFNAIGVLLGANLGTTFTGWIVTILGFKLELSTAALPAIGVGALIQVFVQNREKLAAGGILLLGLGMLLFGLDLMKNAVADLPQQLNLSSLKEINSFGFLLLGLVMTAIIQSSSATMMIALTALYSNMIDLQGAAALVIGADIGTTSTTALGSIQGSVIKRQLALAHFVFNAIVDLLAFFILLPLLDWVKLTDPLYSLVAFHSTFNLLGLLLFVPFIRPFTNWISQRFIQKTPKLSDVPTVVPEAALAASEHQVKTLIASAIFLNLRYFSIPDESLRLTLQQQEALNKITADSNFQSAYPRIKQSEGELLQYAARLQKEPLDAGQSERLQALLGCLRNAVYAVKTIKDISSNWANLHKANTPLLQRFSRECQSDLKTFYQKLTVLLLEKPEAADFRMKIAELNLLNENRHRQLHQTLISDYPKDERLDAEWLSTLLNVNRETWYSCQNLILAVEHWYRTDASQ